MAEALKRREKEAEDKIARAEASAVSEVRAAAVEAAVQAAEQILRKELTGAKQAELVTKGAAETGDEVRLSAPLPKLQRIPSPLWEKVDRASARDG